MTENFEDYEAVELTPDQMDEIAGGYKKLTEKKGFRQYQIKKGENLTRIAKAHNCTVADLLKWNPQIKNKNLIYAGAYLYIKG